LPCWLKVAGSVTGGVSVSRLVVGAQPARASNRASAAVALGSVLVCGGNAVLCLAMDGTVFFIYGSLLRKKKILIRIHVIILKK
jgi:hypothetical protein